VIIKLLKWVIAIALGVGTWILLDLIVHKISPDADVSGRLIWFAFPVIAVSAHLMGVFANDDE